MSLSATFVVDQKGHWNHTDWESFLLKTQSMGIQVDDETKRNLGNLLEAAKNFYAVLPHSPQAKRAAAAKPAARKKSPAKGK
jgi:hypothetical protein